MILRSAAVHARGPHDGEKTTWIHHLCLLEVPWRGEINLGKSGCGGNEQKSVKKGGNG